MQACSRIITTQASSAAGRIRFSSTRARERNHVRHMLVSSALVSFRPESDDGITERTSAYIDTTIRAVQLGVPVCIFIVTLTDHC